MKDGFERRALLLQLGEALAAVGGKVEKGPGSLAVKAAAALQVPGATAAKVAEAFASWPAILLGETLDKNALAESVSKLFAGNEDSWEKYVQAVQKEVPGFGDGIEIPFAPVNVKGDASAEAAVVAPVSTGVKPKAKNEKPAKTEREAQASPVGAASTSESSGTETVAPAAAEGSEAGKASGSFVAPEWPWKPGGPDASAANSTTS